MIRAEGWKWVEVDTDFPYGHTFGMRRIHGEAEPMNDAGRDELCAHLRPQLAPDDVVTFLDHPLD